MTKPFAFLHKTGFSCSCNEGMGSFASTFQLTRWGCAPHFVVPITKWVCTPQLLVSTKWLHTPSDVLMLNVLLEWVCNPFCRKWVYRHVCSPRWFLQNGCWKLSRPTNSYSTSTEELYKMTLSFERRVDLQNGVYKMGWPNPTYPQNQADIHSILRTDPPIL